MNRDWVRALYDDEVRRRPWPQPGVTVETVDSVTLLTGPFNFVSWWDLTPETCAEVVAGVASRFRERGESLIWRIYDDDRPPGLADHLAGEGFVADPPGTLMVLDLADAFDTSRAPDVEVRRVRTLDDLDSFIAAGNLAFDETDTWRRDAYAGRLHDPDLALYIASIDGRITAAARMETHPSSVFAGLYAGGVTPDFRGRGLYRALVAARVADARLRGLKYLSVEARETSRPILERLGFVALARETTWMLKPPTGAA